MTASRAPKCSLFHPGNAEFLAEVAGAIGGIGEMAKASVDPDEATAAYFGVGRAELERWVLSRGRHQCSAVKVRGGRCRHQIKQQASLNPQEWATTPEMSCRRHKSN